MKLKQEYTYTDQEIINGIKHGDHLIIKYLRKQALPFIRNLNGTAKKKSREEEIFQDALVVIFRKINDSGLTLTCRLNTYFLAIVKKILFFKNNQNNKSQQINPDTHCLTQEEQEEIESFYNESKEFQLYRRYFGVLKKRQQMIFAASINGESYRELYQQFGYASVESFKNEVYRIRKNLINRIVSDPEFQKYKNKNNWSL